VKDSGYPASQIGHSDVGPQLELDLGERIDQAVKILIPLNGLQTVFVGRPEEPNEETLNGAAWLNCAQGLDSSNEGAI
jgi:hypothetical protein